MVVSRNHHRRAQPDLAEHADAWHGEVFAQSYLHGLNRPEAEDPTLIGAHKLSPKLKSHKLVDLAQAAGIFHPLDQATLESTRSCVRGLHAIFARIEKALPRRRMWLKFGALATSGPSGGMREGRVLSCRRPSMPSFMNRSCQRQTQVFDLPVRRMISLVPTPSALERMIAARQACFCEALRSQVIASSRPRTDRVIVMEIPVRMRQTRTATETEESQSGLFCQAKTTRRNPLYGLRLSQRRALARSGRSDREDAILIATALAAS